MHFTYFMQRAVLLDALLSAFNINIFNYYYDRGLTDADRSLSRLLEDLEKKPLGYESDRLFGTHRAGEGSCIVLMSQSIRMFKFL